MQIFARLTKVDEQTGKVYGRAVQEVLDRSGEIFDYETSKPNFAKWSESFAKATEGKSVGNVRAMHGKVAAGKLTEITFNDAEKAIDVCAEVVDPVEREKCLKGVYTGFSIGGRYAKKWADEVNKSVNRYTAEPTEISLVDLPCVPTAQFTVIKSDGSEELRKFETTFDDSEALAKWFELLPDEQREQLAKIAERKDVSPKEGEHKYGDVKFADPKNKKYPIDTPAHIRAAWSYIHMPKNAEKYSAADAKAIKERIAAAWREKISKDGPPEAEKMLEVMAERLAKNADAVPVAAQISVLIGHQPKLEKGLWAVSQFAGLLQQLAEMADGVDWEEEAEGDDSTLPAEMRAALKPLAQAFLAMAEEETNEALHGQMNDDAALELAAADELNKSGRKHTKAMRAHRDAIREHTKGINEHLDAMAEDDPMNDDQDDNEKSANGEELQKAIAHRDELLEKAAERIREQEEIIRKMSDEPLPVKAAMLSVSKSADVVNPAKDVEFEPVLKADGTIDKVRTALKKALSEPVTVR